VVSYFITVKEAALFRRNSESREESESVGERGKRAHRAPKSL